MKPSLMAIAKKEFLSYINSPLAYLIIAPFTLIISFLFFRTALLMGDANLRPMVELLPWFLVIIAPALAMRSFSEENRKQTMELLFAHPVSEWTIVGGKFLGLLLFFGVFLLTTIGLPLTLIFWSKPDFGLMLSQYLGAILAGGAFVAVGMATSAYVASSVGAFLLGAVISFLLILVGLNIVILMLPGVSGRILAEMTVLPHLTNFSRGIIDLRDLLYFGTIIGIALTAAVMKLSARKAAESKAAKTKLWVILLLIVMIGFLSNYLMYQYPLRLDTTANQQFSLAPGTKQLLKELPDRVTITLYTSTNLPGPMQATLRETGDRLKDFSRFSDKLAIRSVMIEPNSNTANEAKQKGIREVQFNQIGAGSFAVQTGFLGLSLTYGNKSEVIDFVEDASGLEYQLSRLILKLTREKKPTIGLVMNVGGVNYQNLTNYLNSQYDVKKIDDGSQDKDLAGVSSLIVLDDGSQKSGTVSANISNYLNGGGNGLFLVNGVNINQQALDGTASISDYTQLLKNWGAVVNTDLVYDLQNNEAISMGQGNNRYIINYPFWVKAEVNTAESPLKVGINTVVLGWPSSLSLTPVEGVSQTKLLNTSRAANSQTDNYTIAPADVKALPAAGGKVYSLGTLIEKDKQRLSLIANSTWATDEFIQNSQENGVLLANLIDWVAADPLLSAIPQKIGGRNLFKFSSPQQIKAVQWVVIIMPAVIVIVFGFWWLSRRKKRTRRVYEGK